MRPIPLTEPSGRMKAAKFVSPRPWMGMRTGSDHGPSGRFAKLMNVGSPLLPSRLDHPHSSRPLADVQSQTLCPCTGGAPVGPQSALVNHMTYSPVGARATVGSCEKGRNATSCTSKGASRDGADACTIREFEHLFFLWLVAVLLLVERNFAAHLKHVVTSEFFVEHFRVPQEDHNKFSALISFFLCIHPNHKIFLAASPLVVSPPYSNVFFNGNLENSCIDEGYV